MVCIVRFYHSSCLCVCCHCVHDMRGECGRMRMTWAKSQPVPENIVGSKEKYNSAAYREKHVEKQA